MDSLPPIPSPIFHRLRPLHEKVLPVFGFGVLCLSIFLVWRQLANPSTFVGQAELVQASASTREAGLLTNLWVKTFQEVRAGDLIAEIVTTDPRTANNRLELLRDRMRLMELEMGPVLSRQRSALEYEQLTLDCERFKAELAIAQANLVQAGKQLQRAEELFEKKIIPEKDFQLAQGRAEALRVEVAEKHRIVQATGKTLNRLATLSGAFVPGEEKDPLRAALGVEEDRVKVFEQKIKPLELRAPISGIITALYHRSGEQIIAGTPVATITSQHAERIVGYLPATFPAPPVGAAVEVQTRRRKRQKCQAKVLAVSPHVENLTNSLVPPVALRPNIVPPLGRSISISVPAGLDLAPGEAVDLRVLPERR